MTTSLLINTSASVMSTSASIIDITVSTANSTASMDNSSFTMSSTLNCSLNATHPKCQSNTSDSFTTTMYVVTIVVISVGMVGIGASVNYKILWDYFKKPKAYVLGIAMQLLLMPLLAWALTKIFSMPFGEALGVFIQGCSPGGTVSNVVVYWMDGIVDLSVVMTGSSTLLGMGTMPLWLFIYSKAEMLPSEYKIPYERLILSLALLIAPVAIGVVINSKLPKKAPLISKIFITIASIGIVIIVVINSVFSQVPWVVSWRQVLVATIMPIVALSLGYLVTRIPGLNFNSRISRTISIEVALQNVQIASSVITISFGHNKRLLVQMLLFPLLYYVFQVGYAALVSVLYIVAKRKGWIAHDEPEETSPTTEAQSQTKNGQTNPTFEEEEKQA